jgi:E3 ubiquitin-protein ligase SHPRH
VNTAAGERLNEDKDAQASEGEGEALVRIVGQWGTKIDSLVLDLLLLRMKEETSSDKCVVFSQWTEVLEIVGKALESNGLNFVLCSKKQDFLPHKNLSRFRSDPSVQVLLLPINLGAEGLDLVHANHVFLLEPLLNKTTEIQAINRCDRLGQIKTTRVVKYIIRGTIEERILNQSEELSAPVRLHSPVKSRLKDELHDLDEIRFLLTGRARGESDAIEMV